MNTRVKVAAISLIVFANVSYFYWFRIRRPALPAHMQELKPLAELTSEQRQERVASSFALKDFQIESVATESSIVMIPRAEQWKEQQIGSMTSTNVVPSNDEDSEEGSDSNLPWRAGVINIQFTGISVTAYQTERLPDDNLVLVKEKMANRDAIMTKNGIQVPVLQLISAARYTVDVKKDALVSLQRATMTNGHARPGLMADIPLFLVPHRQLAIGERWVQVGVNPSTVSNTGPRPKVVGKVNRVVKFEGRRAAEISSTSTSYDYTLGPTGDPIKREEERLAYFDLETGEPLWYEVKSKGDPDFTSIVRGCNQKFIKYLLRTPGK